MRACTRAACRTDSETIEWVEEWLTEVLGNLHSLLYACCDRSARGFNLALLSATAKEEEGEKKISDKVGV